MYSFVENKDGLFLLRMKESGLSAVKGFTHGRVSFDPSTGTVQFSKHPPVTMQDFHDSVHEGAILSFALVAPDGTLRPQRRDVRVQKSTDGAFYSPGRSKTPAKNSKEDGWRTRVFKFRAYFTHRGVETEPEIRPDMANLPQWLKDSIERQRRFRDRMVFLCNKARDACRPVNYDEFLEFVHGMVLPELDAFNNSLGRARTKEKISAKRLRRDNPSVFELSRFAGFIGFVEKEGKAVPEGLGKKISAFLEGKKIDFTPVNEFARNLTRIMQEERYLMEVKEIKKVDDDGKTYKKKVYRRITDPDEIEKRRSELELRDWEWKPVANGFAVTLKNRRTRAMSFFEGWPRFSEGKNERWGIHFYFNNGGSDASLLIGKGIRAMKLQASVSPCETGRRWKPDSRQSRKGLHPAQISFRDTLSREQWNFRFALLLHKRTWPDGSLIKEWKLIRNQTGLWLCFTVEATFAKPLTNSGEVGVVHIGWRKEGNEVFPALVYDPTGKGREAFHRVAIDVSLRPFDSANRPAFRFNMGESKRSRRLLDPIWVNAHTHQRAEPNGKDSLRITDTWDGVKLLDKLRDARKDSFKSLLKATLDPVPNGFAKAGEITLHKIGTKLEDPEIARVYNAWALEDREIRDVKRAYQARVAARLEDGYSQVAHDICKLFSEHGISRIVVQQPMLANVARKSKKKDIDPTSEAILEASQENRQRIAPGTLITEVRGIAESYGLTVVGSKNHNISREHNDDANGGCGHINPSSSNRLIVCEGCQKVYDQDENAALNMHKAAIFVPSNPPAEDAA
jgi:hypothetical protein